MPQTDLFKSRTGNPSSGVRHDAPGTSREAAHYIGGSVSSLQRLVLEYVKNHRGTTDREMVDALRKEHGGSESTYRTRRSELVDLGLIEQLGVAVIAGKKHQTWAATAHAFR
jgi:hypothetical protein